MIVRPPLLFASLALGLAAGAMGAESVTCHYSYGGETQALSARATRDPYTVAPVKIGSHFLFRVVLEQGSGAKIYTYADADTGPVPIHVASYPHPLNRRREAPGFTGYQSVYEPLRDSELQYWCQAHR